MKHQKKSSFLFSLLLVCAIASPLVAQVRTTQVNNTAPSQKVEIENVVAINSNKLDFSPTYYEDGIVFVSNRKRPKNAQTITDNMDEWLGDNFMSLYYAKETAEGMDLPQEFSVNITTRYHEGPVSFTRDGQQIFFTRNSYKDGRKETNRKGDTLLKIYSANKNGADWTSIKELPFNVEDYDQCHPTVSANGKVLIFSSNRNGGYGGMDLYKSELINGKWSTPVNLGAPINTKKNEVFPYMHYDGTLYFSSNGHGGYGGLDVVSSVMTDGYWREPVNANSPINSLDDDFGFILDKTGKSGYFSSSRSKGLGKDDIYRFTIAKVTEAPKMEDELTAKSVRKIIAGVVSSQTSGNRLERARVSLVNHNNGQKMTTLTDDKGEFAFRSRLLTGDYAIEVRKEGFNAYSEAINTQQVAQETRAIKEYFFLLSPEGQNALPPPPAAVPVVEIPPITDVVPTKKEEVIMYKGGMSPDLKLGTKLVLEDILFDYGAYDLQIESLPVLEELAALLHQYPNMGVEISAHTDSRGNASYNERLSRKRAESVVRFLVQKGIKSNRLVPQGSGEANLRNNCTDGVSCSEAQHQENRRIEMKMIQLLGY